MLSTAQTSRQLEQTKRALDARDVEVAQIKSRLESVLAELQDSQANLQIANNKLEISSSDLAAITKAHDGVLAELEQTKFAHEDSLRLCEDAKIELEKLKSVCCLVAIAFHHILLIVVFIDIGRSRPIGG